MVVFYVNLYSIRSSVIFLASIKALDVPEPHQHPSDCEWMIPGTCDPNED